MIDSTATPIDRMYNSIYSLLVRVCQKAVQGMTRMDKNLITSSLAYGEHVYIEQVSLTSEVTQLKAMNGHPPERSSPNRLGFEMLQT